MEQTYGLCPSSGEKDMTVGLPETSTPSPPLANYHPAWNSFYHLSVTNALLWIGLSNCERREKAYETLPIQEDLGSWAILVCINVFVHTHSYISYFYTTFPITMQTTPNHGVKPLCIMLINSLGQESQQEWENFALMMGSQLEDPKTGNWSHPEPHSFISLAADGGWGQDLSWVLATIPMHAPPNVVWAST